MKFIAYVSQAERPFSQEDLGELLRHSRARNEKDGVTGCLVYRFNEDFRRGNFIQVLEGPDAAIDDVWRRISNDTRHHTIVVIDEGPIDDRMFSNWSMGFKNVDADDLTGVEGFADLGSDAFWQRASDGELSNGLQLLRSFYEG
ncbi:BLUF domain-containing protein [Nioella sediminis]|uniref:BLUF domain-containing protein n=1 Tax=Nioella sediminis TaxID=1912092 RepID=UPI0008FCF408|nr:BLUF domain-containing protein [Nioella sediminis]